MERCVECDAEATHRMAAIGPLCKIHWKAQNDLHRAWLNMPVGTHGPEFRIAFHGAEDEDIEDDT